MGGRSCWEKNRRTDASHLESSSAWIKHSSAKVRGRSVDHTSATVGLISMNPNWKPRRSLSTEVGRRKYRYS